MKIIVSKVRTAIALATACLAIGTGSLQAQVTTNTILQTFATGGITTNFAGTGSVAGWWWWYGILGNNAGMTNDPTMDAAGSPTSGSLLFSVPFTSAGNQQQFAGSFSDLGAYDTSVTANGLNYTNISFDIHVATNTQPDSSGGFGFLSVGFYQTGTFGGVEIPGAASNGWVHLSVPVDKTKANISSVSAFDFNYNNYGGYPTSTMTFWLDNVSANAGGPPPAPPTLSLAKTVSGLNVFDSSPGQYDRESIITTNSTGYSWVGAGGPVTYSFTLKSYPVNASSVSAQMFLIAGNANIPSYETAPDWNESNVLIFAVSGTATNATGALSYKVGEGSGNSMLIGAAPYTNAVGSGSTNNGSGNFGRLASTKVLGTWSLTFSQNTNVTVTAPDGSTTNYVMPAFDANTYFADGNGFVVMLGSQPNSVTNGVGDEVVYSQMQVTGTALTINDDFLADSTLNTNIWAVLASAPTGVLVVPSTTAYMLNWTVPDAGFSPIVGTNVASAASYNDLGLTSLGQIGLLKSTLIPQSSLPAGQGYYRLIKRAFTQMQVLFPGQTNAPGTSLGYVGSPTPISLAAQGVTPTTIMVNACDATWHIVNTTDTVHLTTSDTAAFPPAGNVNMVNGTATFSGTDGILFQSQGSQTVTASDTSNTAIPNATGTVSVGP